ncbi:TlyA family RNA methyltransferase [Halomonas elongata]|uniref:TlyA family RNA methyltransferase n=1 Tax=Halomonas elongata (strain ATCC 33173 / DSM 2581 / NBRC 15536 / NCIMB 2198 / 1H9) TaxID=768066 RepID=E1VA86_HALED|nr:TlyA family RNA methyltransferase [Halomonas elongata]WBF19176.1 TlyA family RNA methyltransferase [Halomonas elongata]WPU48036.1 TlyA family RNA methyltransferase [Halomonas elongata DSM 2581]CBV41932.1 toxin TlyA family protein [Halomonas elongata DSM 2581]
MPRLDQLLLGQGLARSRTRAQRLIRHGRVRRADDGKVLTRPGEKLAETVELIVDDDPEERYASRAGLKLEALLETLSLDLHGRGVLDVGQSTGGFTDCALRHGAHHVIGVEVGRDQLDDRLREDPRVLCLEGLNARAMREDPRLRAALRSHPVNIAVMDVAFISQTLILPELAAILTTGSELLSLVKPQFEVGPEGVNAQGLVTEAHRYADVEAKLRAACATTGFEIHHWCESPIRGGDGNHEFLLYARRR